MILFMHINRAIITFNNTNQELFKVFKCPKAELCKNHTSHGGEIRVPKNHGCTNGHNHLKACLCNGDEEELLKCYFKNLEAKNNNISSFFKPSLPTSHKEKEAIDWINLVIDKGLPIGVVEDELHRKFRGSNYNFSQKTLRNVIFNMTTQVEKVISIDMRNSGRGSMLHDGWTKYGAHYAGIFACYMRK